MKHLKLFENYNEEPYQEIDGIEFDHEFSRLQDDKGILTFIESENNLIQNIFIGKKSIIENRYRIDIHGVDSKKFNLPSMISIYKFNDDWYMVEVYKWALKEQKKSLYYKCDQFDGLLECLENINTLLII